MVSGEAWVTLRCSRLRAETLALTPRRGPDRTEGVLPAAVKCSPIQAFLKPPGVEEPEPVEILFRSAGGAGARQVERHGEVPDAHPRFPL